MKRHFQPPGKSCCLHLLAVLVLFVMTPFLPAQLDPGQPATDLRHATVSFDDILAFDATHTASPVFPSPALPTPTPPMTVVDVDAGIPLPTPPAASPPTGPLPSAPPLCANFPGPSNDGSVGFLAFPPDTMGAVGPSHVVTTLNTSVLIQNKTGGVISSVSLQAFFTTGLTGLMDVFDPRVIYDASINRFVVIAAAERQTAASSMLLAVSTSNDPTASWNMYQFDGDSSDTNWVDFPIVGVNTHWITVTANMFSISSNTFVGSNIWAIGKTSVSTGVAAISTLFFPTTIGGSIHPTLDYAATASDHHMVQDWNNSFMGQGFLRLHSIVVPPGGTPPTASFSMGNFVTTTPWGDPPDAPQSTGTPLNTGSDRIHGAVFRNGSLWCSHHVGIPEVSPTHTAVRWYEINPVTASALQTGLIDDFGATGLNYFYPSIAVNSQDEVMLGFSGSSATTFAGAHYTFRDPSMPANTMQSVSLLKAGEASYTVLDSIGRNRWGDYSATCVDPADDRTMWTIQEYAASPADTWGTWWGKLDPVNGTLLSSINPTSVTAGDPSFTLTASGSGFGSSHVIRINGTSQATAFINATTLECTVPPGSILTGGSANIDVSDGIGCSTASQALTITNLGLGSAASGILALDINGQMGGSNRRVDVDINAGFTINVTPTIPMIVPPNFAIYGFLGVPTPTSVFAVPVVLGNMCFTPCIVQQLNPLLFTLTNNFFPDPCISAVPSTPAPWTLPVPGIGFPIRVTFQGVIALSPTILAFTNGILLNIR